MKKVQTLFIFSILFYKNWAQECKILSVLWLSYKDKDNQTDLKESGNPFPAMQTNAHDCSEYINFQRKGQENRSLESRGFDISSK